jgi:hypothetical protein
LVEKQFSVFVLERLLPKDATTFAQRRPAMASCCMPSLPTCDRTTAVLARPAEWRFADFL